MATGGEDLLSNSERNEDSEMESCPRVGDGGDGGICCDPRLSGRVEKLEEKLLDLNKEAENNKAEAVAVKARLFDIEARLDDLEGVNSKGEFDKVQNICFQILVANYAAREDFETRLKALEGLAQDVPNVQTEIKEIRAKLGMTLKSVEDKVVQVQVMVITMKTFRDKENRIESIDRQHGQDRLGKREMLRATGEFMKLLTGN